MRNLARGEPIFSRARMRAGAGNAVRAGKKYEPGATDTEIETGNIMPYSGPASSIGTHGPR